MHTHRANEFFALPIRNSGTQRESIEPNAAAYRFLPMEQRSIEL